MATSVVFISAYLKYDTHPRMTWCSATFLRSYPIPLLLPVSILSFAFSLSKLLGWARNLQRTVPALSSQSVCDVDVRFGFFRRGC